MTINATCLNMFIWASHTLIRPGPLYPSFSDPSYGQKLQSSSVDETPWAEPSSLTENG